MPRKSVVDRVNLSKALDISTEVADVEEVMIDVSLITTDFTFTPNGKPLRHFYDMVRLEEWAKSDLLQNGILSPIWLRPDRSIKGKFELVAGMSRYLGANIIDLKKIPAKVFAWNDERSYEAAVSENSNRQDISALEETEHILTILCSKLALSQDSAISLLNKIYEERRGKLTARLDEESLKQREVVTDIFKTYGQIELSTFVTKRLRLLKMEPEVLLAVREGKINFSVGTEIARCKNPEEMRALLAHAEDNSMSLRDVQKHLRTYTKSTKEVTDNLDKRLKKIVQGIREKEFSADLMEEIENFLNRIEKKMIKK
jgi:ParB family transcriptional regulator, chromosome partitioning protein